MIVMYINDIFNIKSYSKPDTPRYKFIKELALGGMGKVSLIEDNDLNRNVVMKTLRTDLKTERIMKQFLQEAKIIGSLEHPNIIPIYDFGIHENSMFYTMKFVKGKTLKQIVDILENNKNAHNLYTWNLRVHIVQQVCEALEYAHSKNVIHLDLKPENIMVGEFGEVMVMDWGISKIIENAYNIDKNKSKSDERITGSPPYMAPEQITDPGVVDFRADLYALGSLLYELLSLQRAHAGSEVEEIFSSVVHERPKSLMSIKNDVQGAIPAELHYITSDLMKKDPAQRQDSANHLKEDLQKFIDGKYPCKCPHTTAKRVAMAFTRLIDGYFNEMVMGIVLVIISLLLLLLFLPS